jgi:hypothetical protein
MMDNPVAIRPRAPVRRAGPGGTRAVRTELSPSQSVTAAQTADAPHAPAPAQESTARESTIDDQAYAIINRTKDESAQVEERAASDDVLMRQRAYARTNANRNEDGDTHADIQV